MFDLLQVANKIWNMTFNIDHVNNNDQWQIVSFTGKLRKNPCVFSDK